MLHPFSPEHGSDLAHARFGSIVAMLEFFLLLVESSEVVLFYHNDLGSTIELASEV